LTYLITGLSHKSEFLDILLLLFSQRKIEDFYRITFASSRLVCLFSDYENKKK